MSKHNLSPYEGTGNDDVMVAFYLLDLMVINTLGKIGPAYLANVG